LIDLTWKPLTVAAAESNFTAKLSLSCSQLKIAINFKIKVYSVVSSNLKQPRQQPSRSNFTIIRD